jgi:AraC-like DNA-binding protein
MLLVDVLLRFASLTITALLVILLVRDAWKFTPARYAVAFFITSMAYSLTSAPEMLRLPSPLYEAALLVAVPSMGLVWWMARSILEDDFKLGPLEWGVMAVASAFKLGWALQDMGITPPAHSFRYIGTYVLSFLLYGHILWVALSGFRNDLVEARRGIRVWLVLVVALSGAATTIVELLGFSNATESIVNHAASLPIMLWAILWLTKLQTEKVFYQLASDEPTSALNIQPKEAPTYRRLIEVMETETAYKDYRLTIQSLAKRVEAPEHQLRALINRTMGYRNFSAFLNRYRINFAKSLLADPEQIRLPILTIAMDSGFQTLSTFNRAFKAMEDETPSMFRARVLHRDC